MKEIYTEHIIRFGQIPLMSHTRDFIGKGHSTLTVLVMGCTSSTDICQWVMSALVHIHNSWGALYTNYLDDFTGVAPLKKAERDFHKLGWLL